MKTTQNLEIPADGIEGLKKNWKEDILAGFLVFLIALPLCLAIAQSSKFPIGSGIITAIIGGIVVTLFHGSHVTIKGPAAGMIVIVAGSVQDLGYEKALGVIVLSGIIQILFGLFRTGKLGDFFPSSAVHGMLAAIGITIAAKQIPKAFGVAPQAKTTIDAILEIPHILLNIHPTIGIIGIVSLVILFTMPLIKNKWVKKIPAPMIVLLVTIPLANYFSLDASARVALPNNIAEAFHFPDFTGLFSGTAIYWVVMYALVGSLESLLSTKAVDILDPYKRKSNLNKDLFAVGIGNTLCGLVGALPMISEIVRSSANINNGAKSKWSNFFHGLFLFVAFLFAAKYINMIPNAALGAMLIFTGFRLASPKVFAETYKIGKEQLIIFVTTIVVTLATDLLIGIFSGIAIKFIIHLIQGASLKSLFSSNVVVNKQVDNSYTLSVYDAAIFSNFLGFKKKLDLLPADSKIVIDFTQAKLIDHTTMEHIHHYAEDRIRAGGELKVTGLETFKSLSKHPLSYRVKADNGSNEKQPRPKQLRSIAQQLQFSFKESTPVVHSNYGKFARNEAVSVKYEGNILSGQIGEHQYTVSDLSVIEGGAMKAQISQLTVLSISNLHLGIPIFALEEEELLDKIMEKAFINDIDFKEFPEFSNRFKLQGINEPAIRKFFNKELIRFFENNTHYCIESLGAEMIIYRPNQMLSPDEILEVVEFGKNLVDVIAANVSVNAEVELK